MSDKLVIVADSTQIQAFMECERLWKYAHDEHLAPRSLGDVTEKPAMLMGTLGHKYMERYYKTLAYGHPQTDALECALSFQPDHETCECGRSVIDHTETLTTDECPTGFRPKPFPLDVVNRALVAQRFREYVYCHVNGDIVPDSPEHVELGFSENLYEDDEHLFVLEGRIDLIGSISGQPCVMDHKFQTRRHDLYKKSIQIRNYGMVTNTSLFILNMIRLTKSTSSDTFERPPCQFMPGEHAWWKKELIAIFHRMAAARRSQTWTQNWSACSGKFGYKCDFTELCDPLESDKTLLEIKKQNLYQIKPEWRPW